MIGNLAVWLAYMLIPLAISRFARLRKVPQMRLIYICFIVFILSCGMGHLADALMTWWPAYRVTVLTAWVTASASWGTLYCMFAKVPELLSIRTVEEVEEQHAVTRHLNGTILARVDMLEAFNRNVCHDLNAPLRTMQGFAEALVEDHADTVPPKAAEFLYRIQAAAVRMRDLLGDLMRLSSLTTAEVPVRPERFDLSALAEGLVEEERQYAANARHRVEVAPGMTARGDPSLVRLLLHALISNAFKFSSRNPGPVVTVGHEGDEFFVADNGVGFDPARAHLLFLPFSRIYDGDDIPGTGIGLSIVKRVAEVHGGSARAEGSPGVGAKFFFTLPGEKV